MKVGVLLILLNILSRAKTLPPIRGDLAILQHHPYPIQRFTDPSYLAKRQVPVATLYYDIHGNIKAIFNLEITHMIVQILGNAGVDLGRSVLAEFQEYLENSAPVPTYFAGAFWAAQLGYNWRAILQRPNGDVTIGLLVRLDRTFRTVSRTRFVLDMMKQWFAQSGYIAITQLVQNAEEAGQEEPISKEGSSITKRQIVKARSDSKFCKLSIQNWPFVFKPGKVDKLEAPFITC